MAASSFSYHWLLEQINANTNNNSNSSFNNNLPQLVSNNNPSSLFYLRNHTSILDNNNGAVNCTAADPSIYLFESIQQLQQQQQSNNHELYLHYLQQKLLSNKQELPPHSAEEQQRQKQQLQQEQHLKQSDGPEFVPRNLTAVADIFTPVPKSQPSKEPTITPEGVDAVAASTSRPTDASVKSLGDGAGIEKDDVARSGRSQCVVCDDIAYGKHYGVFACNGCKGFFRRSILSTRRYSCRDGGECPVTKEQRNFCRFCRLTKCLRSGMNAKLIQQQTAAGECDDSPTTMDVDDNSVQLTPSQTLCDAATQTDFVLDKSPSEALSSLDGEVSAATPEEDQDYDAEQAATLARFDEVTVLTESARRAFTALPDVLRLLRIERTTIEREDSPQDLIRRANYLRDEQRQFSFEFGYCNPELVSPRFPMCFKPVHLSTPRLFLEGWRRYFTYYVDWTRQIDEFTALSDKDQLVLAKQRFAPIGWLVTAYYTPANAHYVLNCMSNGAFRHAHAETIEQATRSSSTASITFYNERMVSLIKQVRSAILSIDMDLFEFTAFKTYLLFRESMGISAEGAAQIRRARQTYTRLLYAYLCEKFEWQQRHRRREEDSTLSPSDEAISALRGFPVFNHIGSNPSERMSNIMLSAAPLTTVSHMMAECVELDRAFQIVGLDRLVFTTHDTL